jgi:hypothetical protein
LVKDISVCHTEPQQPEVAKLVDRIRCVALPAAFLCLFAGGTALAQSPPDPLSNTEWSKETQNPVTRQITLPLRYEADFNDSLGYTKSTIELDQGVVPFRLTDDWALITRTKLPWIDDPPKKLGDKWVSGLGNGYTTFFLSPEHGNGFYWGAGPVLYYPASNTTVGVNKWGSGPSVAFMKKDESPLVFGVVTNNIWSFGGPSGSSDRTNELLINPIVSYHFGDGWAVGTSPNITANWIADGGKWTVPLGGGVSKVVRVGQQPIKLAIDSYYNAVRPSAAKQTWLTQLTVTILLRD